MNKKQKREFNHQKRAVNFYCRKLKQQRAETYKFAAEANRLQTFARFTFTQYRELVLASLPRLFRGLFRYLVPNQTYSYFGGRVEPKTFYPNDVKIYDV